ncbi:MAG TPA: OmpH family outer membrane protein [Candidatus Acidoferrum sp.]|nr:OmpH family outer membrane protein [Candidatus Acidoferrum sp.]
MKKLFLSLLLASSVAGFAAETKIGTIDLRKAFDNYWRTKQADANLKDQAGDLEKERKAMFDQYEKTRENYKKLVDSANDPAVTTDERDKRKKSAENELLSLRTQEDRVKQFDTTSRTTLGEKQRRVRDQILGEIKDKIKAKAKAGNYSMVIDIAAETVNGTPMVPYVGTTDNDITDAVLSELNINAPKDLPKGTEIKSDREPLK